MPAKAGIAHPQGDPSPRWDDEAVLAGTVAGIARHAYSKAPMDMINHAEISVEGGIRGDFRGARKPGGSGRRQVTLIERAGWAAAMAEVGHAFPWWERRANLLVDGMALPRVAGARLRLGAAVVLEMTRRTDPCHRMETLAPGLFVALDRDERCGMCARVIAGGTVAVGDMIRIEG